MKIGKSAKYVLAMALAALGFAAQAEDKPTGILVNGTEITQWGSGNGWMYHEDTGILHLYGGPDYGPYEISGTNTDSRVHIYQTGDATVILKNLHLETTLALQSSYTNLPPFLVGAAEAQPGEEGSCTSKIILEGVNEIVAKIDDDYYTAHKKESLMTSALSILHGSTVEINASASSDDNFSGKLVARGTLGGAAIGGGKGCSTGKIVINGGTIEAYGGFEAAGIGGGEYAGTEGELPGEIIINGGMISATGSSLQGAVPAIGSGLNHTHGYGYKIQINGGTVHAYGAQGTVFRDIASKNLYYPQQPIGYPVIVTGGNIKATILDARDELDHPLHAVTVPEIESVEDGRCLPPTPGYNVDNILPIENTLTYWLPDGYYSFAVNDQGYRASIDRENVTAFKAASISNVSAEPIQPWDGKVKLSYEVAGGDLAHEAYTNAWIATAKVTVKEADAETPFEAKTLEFDEKPFAAGVHTAVWDSAADGYDPIGKELEFAVSYEAKPAACMLVDVSSGVKSTNYPVTYLDKALSHEELYDEDRRFAKEEYWRNKIVLKRVRPGTFRLGGPNEDDPNEPYEVTLTKPYFLGVFEFTAAQYKLIEDDPAIGASPNPMIYASTDKIRGSEKGRNWPFSREVDDDDEHYNVSIMGFLRRRTGLMFDLPTSAQWEYAARAGTTTAHYWGDNFDEERKYAWCDDDTYEPGVRAVGGRIPNAWGFYDVIGNATEICLDRLPEFTPTLTEASYGFNPVGPSTNVEYRIRRGGSFMSDRDICTAYSRVYDTEVNETGFRLALPLDVADFTGTLARGAKTVTFAATPTLLANGGTIDFTDAANWQDGVMPVEGSDIVIKVTADTQIMVNAALSLGTVTIEGTATPQLRLLNDAKLALQNTEAPFNCIVNLASLGAEVSVPEALEWSNVRSAVSPGSVRFDSKDGRKTFYLNTAVPPGGGVIMAGATAEEAMAKVTITITDWAAKAAGQANVVKKVAVPDTTYGQGYWKVSLAIDEEKMPEGKKLADSVAAFASAKTGLTALAGATEAKTIAIPSASLTSGLYYSLLVSPNVNLAAPTETPRALATGSGDLSLTVEPAENPKAPRFFKLKASLLKE